MVTRLANSMPQKKWNNYMDVDKVTGRDYVKGDEIKIIGSDPPCRVCPNPTGEQR
jgi:hypothetical protein